MTEYEIREYLSEKGDSPFGNWLADLRDFRARARIRIRLDRLRLGNLGDCSSVGGGVLEMRLFYGPGYRVYFGLQGANVVVLLYGGTKSTQQRDIRQAKAFWANYRKRNEHS